MQPAVYTSSDSFRQFLQDQLQIPLHFSAALEAPVNDSEGVLLLHLSSFARQDCMTWLQQHSSGGTAAIAICSNQPNVEEMLDCVGQGARAYCNSHMAALHYRQMLGMLTNGQSWFPPELLAQTFKLAQQAVDTAPTVAQLSDLTARENEIATYVAEGMSNREIAQHLGISEPTVKSHLTQIFRKLELNDRVGLVLHLKRA